MLGIREAAILDNGEVVVQFNDMNWGRLYIYSDSIRNAFPLLLMNIKAHRMVMKKILDYLLVQAKYGIRTMVVGFFANPNSTKLKLIDINDTIESFLVQYDLKFT